MAKSKVFFTDFRTHLNVSLPAKLQKLMRKAGIEGIDMAKMDFNSFKAGDSKNQLDVL